MVVPGLLRLWAEVAAVAARAVVVRPAVDGELLRRSCRAAAVTVLPTRAWSSATGCGPVFSPFRMLQKKLTMKMSCATPMNQAAHELTPFSQSTCLRVRVAARRRRRAGATRPRGRLQNIGMKTPFMPMKVNQKCMLAERLVHLPAGRFREPVVDAREEGHDGAGRHDVVEVADHVVRVVQLDVGGGEAERQAGEPADPEHRQEGEREEHRGREADRPAPERQEERRSGSRPTASR